MKQLGKSLILKFIRTARKWNSLRIFFEKIVYLLDTGAVHDLAFNPNLHEGLSWRELDRVYSFCRRKLQSQAGWRYGPARVHEVAREGFEAVSQYTTLQNKVYCDLGCGTYHPYGIATVMFLNGTSSTISLDLREGNKQRAAEALADLLCDCCSCPDKWNWSRADTLDFLSRVQKFDVQALRQGHLDDALEGLPLKHIVTDIHNPVLEEESIDIMTSRAVLEHFLNFDVAVNRLFALMRKGGVACHRIDLVDHRSYVNSDYHYWSFLAEDDDWSDGLVNRLRSSEIRASFERAGFEIVRYENRIEEMPKDFIKQVKGRFREMTEEELSITGVSCVLRKP